MNFFKVILEEAKAVFSNGVILLIVLGGSLLYALLYPTPYKNDVIRNQSIAVVDMDKSSASRELIFFISALPQVKIEYVLSSQNQAKELLLENKIFGYLTISEGFEANLHKGVPSYLGYIANASYFSAYGTIVEALNSAANALGDQVKIKMKTLQTQHLSNDANLLAKESIPLFNISVGYLNYALAAVLIFILHQTAIGGTMLIGAFQNSAKNPLAYYSKASVVKLVVARFLVFGITYFVLFLLFFGFFFKLYHINVQANWIDFWCFAFAFLFATLALGIFLGFLIKDSALPTQIVLVSSLPIVFLLGFIWPIDLIPDFLRNIAKIIPAYHGINGFLRLNQMGAELDQIMSEFFWLLALGVIFSSLAIVYKTLQRSKTTQKTKR
ncbi:MULTISPECIES: ABC transporter permease [unclassified Helicobacter]|uniref:ABC transporter permease n=1 Tax=unclassified Helicobacter TaxID=2593540 RepID=UPI001F434A8F|nr:MULTISPECIES: ABC transporter permease [unclassified Helicobacter]